MIREIKFRAWDRENQVMHVFDSLRMMDNGVFFENSNFNMGDGHNDDTEAILMQFTGLKDVKGREIYDGDRVFVVIRQTVGEDFRGEAEIEWGEKFGCWMLDFPNLGQSMGLEAAEEIEVLGNVHQGTGPGVVTP